MADVYHRLYTHAPLDEFDTTGGRLVPLDERDASDVLTPDVLKDLDHLLKTAKPDGNQTAWVVRRYSSKGFSYACVMTSIPDLVTDVAERRGVLNHARLVQVDAGGAMFDAAALVALAQDFALDDLYKSPPERQLSDYLDQVSGEQTTAVRPVTIDVLQQLPLELLCDVIVACLAQLNEHGAVRLRIPADEDVISRIATAWAALPVALQRASSFAVALADGCPVDVIFSTSAIIPASQAGTPTLRECVNRYLHLLLDTAYDSMSLLRNANIDSLTKLNDFVQRATPMADASAGRTEMSKGKKQEGGRSRAREEPPPLPDQRVSELERQYRSMEASLREYIDLRLHEVQLRMPPPAAPPPSASSGSTFLPWTIAAISLFFAVVMTVLLVFRPEKPVVDHGGGTPTQTTPSTENPEQTNSDITATPELSPNRKIFADAIAHAHKTNQWKKEWETLIANHGSLVSPVLGEVAGAQKVPTKCCAAPLRTQASKIDHKQNLGDAGHKALRVVLLEYIATLDASPPETMKVNGDLNDIPADLLERIKKQFKVENAASKSSEGFQAEVILRWLESREP